MKEPNPKSKRSYFQDIGFGTSIVGLLTIRWAFHLTKEWGYHPSRGLGLLLSLGLFAGFILLITLADYGLRRAGLDRMVRDGLWTGAIFGPMAALTIYTQWGHPVWSELGGIAAAVLVFTGIHLLRRSRQKRRDHGS
jgi:hypothetical protein